MSNESAFITSTPDATSCWRAIVLFGRNTASYKFALASALLEARSAGIEFIKLDDLALPFSRALCRHIGENPRQGTMTRSRFLDACQSFNRGECSEDQLRAITVRDGFSDVLDAFHIVNQRVVPYRFFIDERAGSRGIRLTEECTKLLDHQAAASLPREVEARWRLVETAWSLDVPHRLITVEPEGEDLRLIAKASRGRRVQVTSARDALNGYQKGKCFYCYRALHIGGDGDSAAEVDHVLPHTLVTRGVLGNLDGIWNLVLACKECNRGPKGKLALVPDTIALRRLHVRNEYYVTSHHPLRETIIAQTGGSENTRRSFLESHHRIAIQHLVHTWAPPAAGDAAL